MKRYYLPVVLAIMLSIFFVWGCDFNLETLTGASDDIESTLMFVEINFSENAHLIGYVKTLGLEKDAIMLVGGASVNNLYDKNGNVIASFNYARVNYIKIIPEP